MRVSSTCLYSYLNTWTLFSEFFAPPTLACLATLGRSDHPSAFGNHKRTTYQPKDDSQPYHMHM